MDIYHIKYEEWKITLKTLNTQNLGIDKVSAGLPTGQWFVQFFTFMLQIPTLMCQTAP